MRRVFNKIKAGLVLLALTTITIVLFHRLDCAGLVKVTTSGVSTRHEDLYSYSHINNQAIFSKRQPFVFFAKIYKCLLIQILWESDECNYVTIC